MQVAKVRHCQQPDASLPSSTSIPSVSSSIIFHFNYNTQRSVYVENLNWEP